MSPALPLFAQLRRYTLATLTAAEIAADLAGVIEIDNPDMDPADVEAFDPVEIERGHLMTLPANSKMNQLKAEQPTEKYAAFKQEILKGGRARRRHAVQRRGRRLQPIQLRFGQDGQTDFITRAYSSASNGSPSRRATASSRTGCRKCELAALSPSRSGMFGFGMDTRHVDPTKEANAQNIHLNNGTATYSREYAKMGLDWRREREQAYLEAQFDRELEKKYGPLKAQPALPSPAKDTAEPDDDDDAEGR